MSVGFRRSQYASQPVFLVPSPMIRPQQLFVSAVITGCVWLAAPALACAPAMERGKSVSITGEEALIVWDAERGVEHFIRRGEFRTDADDFGFLVPTPSPPELSEVDNGVFDRLRSHIAPPIEYNHPWVPITLCMTPFVLTFGAKSRALQVSAGPSGVEVLSTARVAGLDATVVRSTDAEALATWLDERGYENRPALVDWLRPYVDDGFVITAFQFTKGDPGSSAMGNQAVRMSFETDRPFYPYREPSDHLDEPGRALRVHVVATERAFPSLDAVNPGDGPGEWGANEVFAAPIEDADGLLGGASGDVDGDLWLTSFLDSASLRQSADLRFDVRPADEVRPDPIIIRGEARIIPMPLEPAILLGGGIWWWRRRKAKISARRVESS